MFCHVCAAGMKSVRGLSVHAPCAVPRGLHTVVEGGGGACTSGVAMGGSLEPAGMR